MLRCSENRKLVICYLNEIKVDIVFSKFTWDQLNESVVPPHRQMREEILKARREVNVYKDISRQSAAMKRDHEQRAEKRTLKWGDKVHHNKRKFAELGKDSGGYSGSNGVTKKKGSRPAGQGSSVSKNFSSDILSKIFTS